MADLGAAGILDGRQRDRAAPDDWLHAMKRRRLAFVSATQQDDEAQRTVQVAEIPAGTGRHPPPIPVAATVSVGGPSDRCVMMTVPDGAVDSESSVQADELVLLSWLASTRPWSSNAADHSSAAASGPPRRVLQVGGDGLAGIGTAALLGGGVQAVVLSAPHLAGLRESQQPL